MFLLPDSIGKRASVHTCKAAENAFRCFACLIHSQILPARKMFLDLSEPHFALRGIL